MKAQDYKDIKTSNADTVKVMANNEIWWEKLYFWGKFKLKPNYKKEEDVEMTQEIVSGTEINEAIDISYLYPRVNFSKSRKVFEGSGELQYKDSYRDSFGFGERNGQWYKVFFSSDGLVSEAYKMGYKITYRNVFSHYSKGDFIEEVKSNNKDKYPINGQKGNYWYVFKS